MPDLPMDCLDVTEARLRSEPLSEAARAHVAACPICAETTAAGAPLDAEASALLARVRTRVDADRGTLAGLRALPTRTRVLGAALASTALVTALALSGAPRGAVPASRTLLAATVLAALLAAALRVALRPLQELPLTPGARASLLAGALGVPVALAVLPIGASPDAPGANAALCLSVGVVAGGALLLALRALDRGGHAAPTRAVIAAAAGGVLGNLALELHCAVRDPAHLLLGHAAVGFVLVAVYGALGLRRRA